MKASNLYSDTSMFATGSVLYQIQNGQPKLIAYTSKRNARSSKELFHHRTRNVWIRNEHHFTFWHLLKKVVFDAIADHLAITHIMKSKAEPGHN